MQNSAYGWTSSLSSSLSSPSSPLTCLPSAAINKVTGATVLLPKVWLSDLQQYETVATPSPVNETSTHSPADTLKAAVAAARAKAAVDLSAQVNPALILEQISNASQHVSIANSIGSTDSPASDSSDSSYSNSTTPVNEESKSDHNNNNNNQLTSDLDGLWTIGSSLSNKLSSQESLKQIIHRNSLLVQQQQQQQQQQQEQQQQHLLSDACCNQVTAKSSNVTSSSFLSNRLSIVQEKGEAKIIESNQNKSTTSENSDSKKDKSSTNNSSSNNNNNNNSCVDLNYSINHLTAVSSTAVTMHPSNSLSTLSSLQQPSLLQLTANSIVQMSNSNIIGSSSLNSTGTNGSSNSASSASGSISHRRSGNSRNKSSSSTHSQQGKSFLCHVCHRTFTQKGNLKTHMMIHSGDKPYACNICGKSFTQKGNVDTHMKIHTGEKDYSCRSCGKGFTQRGNLKTHERSVHTKEKPYACTICGKAFSQKGNMVTHLRTHNKDDRFPCDLCGKTFSQKGNLKTHKLRHSGTLPARKYGQRRQNANRMGRGGGSGSGGGGGHGASSHQQHNNHHQQGPSSQQQLPLHLATSNLLGPAVGQSGSGSSGQFNMNHSGGNNRAHLKSTDEESESSSVEHSMDGGLLHVTGSPSNLMSPVNVTGRSGGDLHVATTGAGGASLHHSLNDTNHLINRSGQPGAPLTAFGFANHRFYSPSTSTISAPQAHLAATAGLSWLTSVAASSATAKSRMTNHHHHHHHHHHPHDSFGLNAAAAYTAAGLTQHPNHNLARLTLLPTSSGSHVLDHHLTGTIGPLDKTRSSNDHHNPGQAQNDYHTSPQVSSASGQANPDFSQLLD